MFEKLTIEVKKSTNKLQWILRGALDERAELPRVVGTPLLHIDMRNVSHVNSTGIRVWCDWIAQNSSVRMVFENCPVNLTKQFSTVRGFVAANASVQSFYVPYLNETTDERKDHLYVLGREFDESGNVTPPRVLDSKGGEMEMDVFGNNYFRFLKK